jgi:hypothetical protein
MSLTAAIPRRAQIGVKSYTQNPARLDDASHVGGEGPVPPGIARV